MLSIVRYLLFKRGSPILDCLDVVNSVLLYKPAQCLALIVSLSGCLSSPTTLDQTGLVELIPDVSIETAVQVPQDARASLSKVGNLWTIARQAEQQAIEDSSAGFDILAAQSDAAAIRTGRLPKISPVASIDGDGDTSLGVSLNQTIWDFGSSRAQIKRAEVDVVIAEVDQWIEINEAIFEALDVYLTHQRSLERLDNYSALQANVNDLAETVSRRFDGGVAGRSENLEVSIILQELARDILDERSEQAAALIRFRSLIGEASATPGHHSSVSMLDECTPQATTPEPPEVLRARFLVQRSLDDLDVLKSRRLPVLIGNIDARESNGGIETSAGLSIDASQLLGWDRAARLEAGEQRVQAAQQEHQNVSEAVRLDIQQLQDEYTRQQASLVEIDRLLVSARESENFFEDLFNSGRSSLDDGLQLKREVSILERSRSDRRIELVRTCLRIGRIQGTLILGEQTQ